MDCKNLTGLACGCMVNHQKKHGNSQWGGMGGGGGSAGSSGSIPMLRGNFYKSMYPCLGIFFKKVPMFWDLPQKLLNFQNFENRPRVRDFCMKNGTHV